MSRVRGGGLSRVRLPNLPHSSAAPERLDVRCVGAGTSAEYGCACDEDACARADRLRRGLRIDATVDLNADTEILLHDTIGDRLDLLQLARDEFLTAEAGIDAHHQDEVELFQHIVEHLCGCGGIERYPRFL